MSKVVGYDELTGYPIFSEEKEEEERKVEDTIPQMLQKITENICDNFCKYNETCDENCECEWIRSGNDCPLDRLV